jgi:hypothetical protein
MVSVFSAAAIAAAASRIEATAVRSMEALPEDDPRR